jgi:DNA helicase IV
MDYKKLMGYGDKKKITKKESKLKVNKVLESIKNEFNLNEGPAYEYKKHHKKIQKSLKDLQKNYLDFYENLRKKGLNDEAADNYKKNVVGFTKKYNKDFGKLL